MFKYYIYCHFLRILLILPLKIRQPSDLAYFASFYCIAIFQKLTLKIIVIMGNCYEDSRAIDETKTNQIVLGRQREPPNNIIIIAELKSLPAILPPIQSRMQQLGPFTTSTSKTIYQLKDKSVYQGDFKNRLFHGPGKLILADGTVIQSEFSQGVPTNQTRIFKSNGDYFSGNINSPSGQQTGKIFQRGILYEGQLLDNKPHGKGSEKSRHYKFEGYYENGLKSNGKLQWNIQNPKIGQFYQGPFLNNKFHGLGKLRNHQGIYNGNFEDGVKNGYGQLTYPDGRVYKGNFYHGKQDGEGKIYSKLGIIMEQGQWINGKKVINQNN